MPPEASQPVEHTTQSCMIWPSFFEPGGANDLMLSGIPAPGISTGSMNFTSGPALLSDPTFTTFLPVWPGSEYDARTQDTLPPLGLGSEYDARPLDTLLPSGTPTLHGETNPQNSTSLTEARVEIKEYQNIWHQSTFDDPFSPTTAATIDINMWHHHGDCSGTVRSRIATFVAILCCQRVRPSHSSYRVCEYCSIWVVKRMCLAFIIPSFIYLIIFRPFLPMELHDGGVSKQIQICLQICSYVETTLCILSFPIAFFCYKELSKRQMRLAKSSDYNCAYR